jgi:hypothetical protein
VAFFLKSMFWPFCLPKYVPSCNLSQIVSFSPIFAAIFFCKKHSLWARIIGTNHLRPVMYSLTSLGRKFHTQVCSFNTGYEILLLVKNLLWYILLLCMGKTCCYKSTSVSHKLKWLGL